MANDELAHLYVRDHPAAAASVLNRHGTDDVCAFLGELPEDVVAPVLHYISSDLLNHVLDTSSDETVANWLAGAELQHAMTPVMALPLTRRDGVIRLLPANDKLRLRTALRFQVGTVGAHLSNRYTQLEIHSRADDARKMLRTGHLNIADPIYTVEGDARLVGAIDPVELFVRPGHGDLSDFSKAVPSLKPDASLSSVRVMPVWRERHVLPVVDGHGNLIGALHSVELAEEGQERVPLVMDVVLALFRVMTACTESLLRR